MRARVKWGSRTGSALLMLALALPAFGAIHREQHVVRDGQGWVQESSGPLPSEKFFQVSQFVGSVRVVTGAKTGSYLLRLHSQEVQEKDARRLFETFHLGIGRLKGANIIQTVGPIDMALRAELILQLPAATDILHVDTMAGKITVSGRVRQLDLQTHGGDIELDNADVLRAVTMGGSVVVNHRLGDSFIRTDGGDIRVDASVGNLEIASLGGNIWLKAIANGRVQSGGGNIEVVRCAGTLLVRTAGGNINLGEMGGAVTAETGGGSIRVGVAHGAVAVSTALGDIELWKVSQGARAHTGMGRITAEFIGDRNSMHDSELVTSMGDIVVYFAGSVPGNLHAVAGASPTKRMISEFPELKISSGVVQYGPKSIVAEGSIHGGGPEILMRTMVGQIELRNVR
ncbi:MAG: hypothetical protein P4L40_17270 [Terracidiphilus sp.]|nr:hypothetical protein [Terracidiphilus sp.]